MDSLPIAARDAADAVRRRRDLALREDLAAVTRQDQAALARIYDRMHGPVFALVLRILPEHDLAEEVLLDVFLQAWRRAATYDGARGEVAAWLLTIARSRALDRRRGRAVRARLEECWKDEIAQSAADCRCGCDPLARGVDGERRVGVRAAVQALPESQRRVVELAFLAGLSHTEIADRTGEPLGTVKTRLRLGMARLRETLRAWEDEA